MVALPSHHNTTDNREEFALDARIADLHVVVMGVAGCGKSEIGRRLAARLGVTLIEGDTFHSAESVAKMRDGVPLTDADRAGWLRVLGATLAEREGAVLTCSALRRSYREMLRNALAPVPLYFLFLKIDESTAQSRVAARADHFYPASLVASQFATLEDPSGEPGVLKIDATLAPETIASRAGEWLMQMQSVKHTLMLGAINAKS
jgi:gluconokinase